MKSMESGRPATRSPIVEGENPFESKRMLAKGVYAERARNTKK